MEKFIKRQQEDKQILIDRINELEAELEAIKTHRENFRHSSYIEWLRELDKILEAEG